MPARKTTMYFNPEDDERIAEIKAAQKPPITDDVAAVRYALHNCKLPTRRK